MSPRPYRLGKREATVEGTRERVILAARAIFSEAGFFGTTLEDVAKRAGVARATVYYQFESKLGLLDAAIEYGLQQAGGQELRRARETDDPSTAVRSYIKAVCAFWSGDYDFHRHVVGVGAVDPEAATIIERYDARRREMLVWLTKRLDDAGRLRPGMTPRHATDVLWWLSSFSSFDHLHRRSGLSAKASAALLAYMAETILAGGTPAPRAPTKSGA